jgi:hypothetical protein
VSPFIGLPATRDPDCTKLYTGPGKNSDEVECGDGCEGDDGCWASPTTKVETKVKKQLCNKMHTQTN